MATIMEKDVLIERAAACLGFLARQNLSERLPVQDQLVELRQQLYGTDHNNIDYQAMSLQFQRLEKENGIKHG